MPLWEVRKLSGSLESVLLPTTEASSVKCWSKGAGSFPPVTGAWPAFSYRLLIWFLTVALILCSPSLLQVKARSLGLVRHTLTALAESR